MSAHLDEFKAAGGVCLIVYSALLSRGVDQCKMDMASSGTEPPLVVGPHSVCSSDLMSLLLRGVASENIFAYNPLAQAVKAAEGGEGGDGGEGSSPKVDWPQSVEVGMLSSSEKEFNMPVCDRLKSPDAPVWILHGGDHFTTAFAYPFKECGASLGLGGATEEEGAGKGAGEGDGGEGEEGGEAKADAGAEEAVVVAAGEEGDAGQGDAGEVPTLQLRRRCKELGLDRDGSRVALLARLEEAGESMGTAKGAEGGAEGGEKGKRVLSGFTLWHWNGLPPSGPRMSQVKIQPKDAPGLVNGSVGPAKASHKPVYVWGVKVGVAVVFVFVVVVTACVRMCMGSLSLCVYRLSSVICHLPSVVCRLSLSLSDSLSLLMPLSFSLSLSLSLSPFPTSLLFPLSLRYYKPLIGEIDDIVQARPADKQGAPNRWDTWHYEVCLV